MRTQAVGTGVIWFVGLSLLFAPGFTTDALAAGELEVITLGSTLPEIPSRNPNIRYDLDLSKEHYCVFVPASYTAQEAYGLVVYISSDMTKTELPSGWQAVLERRKCICLIPQAGGNDRDTPSRCGLAVLGALKMQQKYKIDPQRVYATGLSGGARMSGLLGMFQSDVFHGTVQCCGADFYEPVPEVHPVPKEVAAKGAYGLVRATPEEIAAAKANVRFVIVTGPDDWRYASLLNLYEGGFSRSGLKVKLIDVPGMGHETCGGKALSEALDFIEGTQTATAPMAASGPAAPKWMSNPPNQWVQMALVPEIILKDKQHYITCPAGFLVRLPNGTIIAVSAKHAVCNEKGADALESSFSSFLMRPNRTQTGRSVSLLKLAIKPTDAARLDCVLMTVAPQVMPAEVRPARVTPAEQGETVYLVVVPYEGKTTQVVHKGTVRRERASTDDEFAYELEDHADTMGDSGTLVLDATGNIVGLHLGGVDFHDGKPMKRALNMSTIVAVCTVPGAAQAATKPSAGQGGQSPGPAPKAPPAGPTTRTALAPVD